VYVTAGEADGDGRCASSVDAARDEHAGERQRGVRAAYAQMANPALTAAQADGAAWTRELIVPDPETTWPHTVERYTLNTSPNIRLIFMNLREDGDSAAHGPEAATIRQMLDDRALVTNTIVPSCGPAGSCLHSPSCNPDVPWQNYTHDDLAISLADLINMYQPYVIRTLDPEPLELIGNGTNVCPGEGRYDVCFDNLDHSAVARYVDHVVSLYHGPYGSARYTLVHYRGYQFINYLSNVGNESYLAKRAAGEAYRQARVPSVVRCEQSPCPIDPYYTDTAYEPYYQAMHERYPGSTEWLQRTSDGRLVAVGVEDRQVVMWYENTIDGTWTGPVALGGGAPIAPHLTLLTRPDGLLQIVGTRLPLGMENSPPVAPLQEVITAVQTGPAPSFGAWQSLGAPDDGAHTGVATAAIDGTGRLFAFARNSEGLPAYTYATDDSTWAAWAPLATSVQDILDGLAAITRDDGAIEVFATARTGATQRYVQAGRSFVLSTPSLFQSNDAASPPTVAKNQDGRIEIFYREATDTDAGSAQYGRVLTEWVARDGQWNGPAVLYGDAGVGPVAAIRRDGSGEIMLFERNTWNGLSTTGQSGPNTSFVLQWNLRGGVLEEYPAAATDGLGRVVVMVKGVDGKLYYQRESSASAIGDFHGWVQAGE
jgi:hypothetical protein